MYCVVSPASWFILEEEPPAAPFSSGRPVAVVCAGAKALLDRNPRPSENDVRQALAANLCRCGTHNRIVRAVLRAANEMGRT